ncbi:Mbov_0401 family ICE element transposase-like protein [Spiroplasma endosymbiont of Dilophus febrilis]|uniref:Mbov_0401 family ICE element transposase-like protein n=1 Tax=Spiroplasma endosymbiont of Dilophus febrilis TaxID=3066292 RepID=UPI00313DAB6E
MFLTENYYDKKIANKFLEYEQDIKNEFESLDEKLFRSKPDFLFSIGKFNRTVITPYGVVCFKRRKYRYLEHNTWKYLFLLDNEIGLKAYQRITTELKLKILSNINDGKRQKDILDMYSNANISRMSISNIINEFKSNSYYRIAKNNIFEKDKIDLESKFLYIQLDETFLNLKRNNKASKYKIRLATFHTGYDKKANFNRPKLENKRAFYIKVASKTPISTEKYLDLVLKEINIFYKNINFKKIIVCGDGASWIRKFAEFYKFPYILDKFHLIRYFKGCLFSNRKYVTWEMFKDLLSSYFNGNCAEIISHLKKWLIVTIDSNGNDKIKEAIKYVENNKDGIHSQELNWNIGCSIESDISHMVKSALGYGAKVYCNNNFKTIMDLRIAKVNEIDILKYYEADLLAETAEQQAKFKRLRYIHWSKMKSDYQSRKGKNRVFLLDSIPVLLIR